MSVCKLILKNVRRNLSDYLIYFLTLMLSVSLFYAFNSIPGQPAFQEMSVTKALLYQQLDDLLAFLSAAIAVVLAFLVIYANGFLLRRRKKELGLYLLLGMKKSRISRIFVGETFCVGLLSLAGGILLGLFLSQGLSLVSLRLFAVELESFRFVFSLDAPSDHPALLCSLPWSCLDLRLRPAVSKRHPAFQRKQSLPACRNLFDPWDPSILPFGFHRSCDIPEGMAEFLFCRA